EGPALVEEDADLDGLRLRVGEIAPDHGRAHRAHEEQDEDETESFHAKPPLAITGGPAIEAGAQKVPNPNTPPPPASTGAPAREDQPFEAAAARRGGGGRSLLEDVESRRERHVNAVARDGKGRAIRALAERIEAAQQQAARPENVVEHLGVLEAPVGIDGAEARVLPRRIEGAPIVCS